VVIAFLQIISVSTVSTVRFWYLLRLDPIRRKLDHSHDFVNTSIREFRIRKNETMKTENLELFLKIIENGSLAAQHAGWACR